MVDVRQLVFPCFLYYFTCLHYYLNRLLLLVFSCSLGPSNKRGHLFECVPPGDCSCCHTDIRITYLAAHQLQVIGITICNSSRSLLQVVIPSSGGREVLTIRLL